MGVSIAFLNVDLEEEIFMEQPEGYEVPETEDKVCRLKEILVWTKAISPMFESSVYRVNDETRVQTE